MVTGKKTGSNRNSKNGLHPETGVVFFTFVIENAFSSAEHERRELRCVDETDSVATKLRRNEVLPFHPQGWMQRSNGAIAASSLLPFLFKNVFLHHISPEQSEKKNVK